MHDALLLFDFIYLYNGALKLDEPEFEFQISSVGFLAMFLLVLHSDLRLVSLALIIP